MSDEDLIRALRWCKAQFEARGYEPQRADPDMLGPDRDMLGRHALWMANEALTFAIAKPQKAHRWLGFVQCALWGAWQCTIAEMKAVNRPAADFAQAVL